MMCRSTALQMNSEHKEYQMLLSSCCWNISLYFAFLAGLRVFVNLKRLIMNLSLYVLWLNLWLVVVLVVHVMHVTFKSFLYLYEFSYEQSAF